MSGQRADSQSKRELGRLILEGLIREKETKRRKQHRPMEKRGETAKSDEEVASRSVGAGKN